MKTKEKRHGHAANRLPRDCAACQYERGYRNGGDDVRAALLESIDKAVLPMFFEGTEAQRAVAKAVAAIRAEVARLAAGGEALRGKGGEGSK